MSGSRAANKILTTVKTVAGKDGLSAGIKAEAWFLRGNPFLLEIKDSYWGPLAALSLQELPHTLGCHLPKQLGVVRQPFAIEQRPLRDVMWLPHEREKCCYISGKLLNSMEYNYVVDQYQRFKAGLFRLKVSSTNLIQFIREQGIKVSFLPDHLFDKEETGIHVHHQSTNSVLMIAPTGFQLNSQTATDNKFMPSDGITDQSDGGNQRAFALQEFHQLYKTMTNDGKIKVDLFNHDPGANTPDAVFPNNWFSTHMKDARCSYTLVLYPLKAPNRRSERRPEIIEFAKPSKGEILDLTSFEKEGKFLEGTGSLVLDRYHRIAFLSRSERSHPTLAEIWTKEMRYSDLISFDAVDEKGFPIYHTNVMMSIGSYFAVICLEAIPDIKQQSYVMDTLSKHRTVIPITLSQMRSMCGNILELLNENGLPILCMSTKAFLAFSPEEIETINRHVTKIIHAPIDTIEKIGGGGVRCAVAELFRSKD